MEAVTRFSWSPDDIRKLIDRQATEQGRKLAKVVIELPRPKRGDKFVRGPIPLDWIQKAIPCARKSVNVALAIWYLAGFKNQSRVKLTAHTLEEFGVTPQTARAILRQFEIAGLVVVDRQKGRSPIVTVLPLNSQQK